MKSLFLFLLSLPPPLRTTEGLKRRDENPNKNLSHNAAACAFCGRRSARFTFFILITRRGRVSQELAHIRRKLTPTSSSELRQGQTTEALTNTPGALKNKTKKNKRRPQTQLGLSLKTRIRLLMELSRRQSAVVPGAVCARRESATSHVCSAVASNVAKSPEKSKTKQNPDFFISSLGPERMSHAFFSITLNIKFWFPQRPKVQNSKILESGISGDLLNDEPS